MSAPTSSDKKNRKGSRPLRERRKQRILFGTVAFMMNSPGVLQKLASASKGKATANTQVPNVPRSVRADTSVISQPPPQKVQSASQFLNIESADSAPDPEEGKVGPTIGTSVQSVLPGGSLAVPMG